ncbi:MAG: cation:dicarboxylase symporter family transporter [Gemmatimonadaceae bacterium]
MNESRRVLLSLVIAMVLGIVVASSGRADLLHLADSVAPIGTLWVNSIRMTVFPLVVALLITGVASTSGVREIGRLGRLTLVTFLLMLTFIVALVMPVATAAFRLFPPVGSRPMLPPGASSAASEVVAAAQTNSFGAWLATLLPANPIAAAANGQLVPLVLFTALLALAIVRGLEEAFGRRLRRSPSVGRRHAGVGALGGACAAPIGVFGLVLPPSRTPASCWSAASAFTSCSICRRVWEPHWPCIPSSPSPAVCRCDGLLA